MLLLVMTMQVLRVVPERFLLRFAVTFSLSTMVSPASMDQKPILSKISSESVASL